MEGERFFYVKDNFKIVVRETQVNTYVLIESNGVAIKLDADSWKKFKKWFSIIDTEFDLRYKED
jgi:hypothetical protein